VRYAAKTYGQSSIAWFSRLIRIRFRWKVRCGQSLARTSGWAPTVRWYSRNRRSMDLINHGLGCRGPYRRQSTVTPRLRGRPSRRAAVWIPQPARQRVLGLRAAAQVHTYGEMQQRLEVGRQLAPHLQGASQTWLANFCIDWPVKPTNPPKTLNVRGVPSLLIHAAHDPSDSYTWAHGLAAQIDGSALLTRTGDGHTSVNTSDCAKSAMDAFLIDRRSEPNRICEG
jgi:pimeloyl-ACP methyl ester carboxylesterase